MRIILYTGKGGVGKTSIAAATACNLASEGKKVLIISTDQAHSLGDSLDQRLSNDITNVKENMDAMEIDIIQESEQMWGGLKEYMKRILTSRSKESIEVEELLVFPGLEEMLSLIKIKSIYDENKYDVLLVDCAPTGETMALLKYPDMFNAWIEKVLPFKRKIVKAAGPLLEKATKIPMPQDKMFDELETLLGRLDELRKLLTNKDVVSVRIVTTPEAIVVKEAKRAFSWLCLFNYNVDALIVNRIYPVEAMEGYFHKWIINQKESLNDIKTSFSMIPVFYMELLKTELRTVSVLSEAAGHLYEGRPADEIFAKEEIFLSDKTEEGDRLRVRLPFADKEELDLEQKGEELVITVKNQSNSIFLPGKFKHQEVVKAKYEEGYLDIYFSK